MVGHWNSLSRGVVTAPNLDRAQEALGEHPWAHGVILEWSWAGPGAGLSDLSGTLPNQDMLIF